MAIETSAAIHIRVDGQQEATGAAQRIESAFVRLNTSLLDLEKASGKAGKNVSETFRDLGRVATSLARDFGGIVTASTRIDLPGARQQAIALEEGYTRAGIAGKRSFQDVAGGVERTSRAILEQPDRVLAWGNAVGRLTYNYQGLEKAAEAAGKEGIADNQSLGDLQGFTVTLRNVLGVSGDTADALARVRGQAEKLGTVGGAAALRDQIEAASGALSQFAANTDTQRNKITALVGVLGQGIKNPQQAQQVQQSVLGRIAADPIGIQRFLGHNILDQQGQIEDPAKVIQDVVAKVEKTYGKNARRVLQQNFGAVAGAQLDNLFKSGGFDQIGKVAQAAPSQGATEAQQKLANSKAGERIANQLKKDKNLREHVGGNSVTGYIADQVAAVAARFPVATNVAASVAAIGGSVAAKALLTKVAAGGIAQTAGTVAAAGAGTLAAGAAGVLGAGAILYGVTTDDPRKQYERFERRAGQGSAARAIQEGTRRRAASQSDTAGAAPQDVPTPLQVPGQPTDQGASLAGLTQEIAKLVDALGKGGGITIVNQTGGPISAVDGRRAGGSAGAQ